MKKFLFSISLFHIFLFSISQTVEERRAITESNNKELISVLQDKIQAFSLEKKKKIDEFLQKNPEVLKRYEKDNILYEIVDISPFGSPIYYSTFNEVSSKTIQASSLYTGGDLGLNINGENMVAGIWDGGLPLPTHIEFAGGKITAGDSIKEVNNHATHVAGTIVAKGLDSRAKGIAPEATLLAYDWTDDIYEMASFAAKGYLVSNHSYGLPTITNTGFVLPTLYFGSYIGSSYNADFVAYANKNYQIIKAAGNDRANFWKINPHKKGYELITAEGISKNVLTVAAVHKVVDYQKPSDVKMSDFSSPGPTDDGRIKPNISADGVDIYSTVSSKGNKSYGVMPGTSMASPAITGAVLLLQQHYKNLNNEFMKSATVRGLLQHTALEAGPFDGPDYSFGWGLANIKASAEVITHNKKTSLIEENILESGAIYKKVISIKDDKKPLIVSISWTDLPAENYNLRDTDPDVLYLVNDLDVRVVDPSGKTYYPWKLNGKKPWLSATKGDNIVDNFERIDIPNPQKGEYTVTISHKGNLKELNQEGHQIIGNQEYSLLITGSGLDLDPKPINLETDTIYPNPAKDVLHIRMQASGKYEIYGVTGMLLSSGNLSSGDNNINVSGLSKGIYIIKLKSSLKSHTQKIIIE